MSADRIRDLFDPFLRYDHRKDEPADKLGFAQPKDEYRLSREDRVHSRIGCNRYILSRLRGQG